MPDVAVRVCVRTRVHGEGHGRCLSEGLLPQICFMDLWSAGGPAFKKHSHNFCGTAAKVPPSAASTAAAVGERKRWIVSQHESPPFFSFFRKKHKGNITTFHCYKTCHLYLCANVNL